MIQLPKKWLLSGLEVAAARVGEGAAVRVVNVEEVAHSAASTTSLRDPCIGPSSDSEANPELGGRVINPHFQSFYEY